MRVAAAGKQTVACPAISVHSGSGKMFFSDQATMSDKTTTNEAFPVNAPFAIATAVQAKALESLLTAQQEINAEEGHYRDTHPWLVAHDMFQLASDQQQEVALLFASQSDSHTVFSHWAKIRNIEVIELHRGSWETRVRFSDVQAVNPIWQDIDSVMVLPSAEQRDREEREGIRVYRTALDEYHIHPYAICEAPAFIT